MKLPALKKLCLQGEGKAIEFKKSTGEVQSALKTLCAFSNGAGGQVLIR